MPGKKKDAGSEAVLTFRLPRGLHQRLVDASAGRSVSEEMRRRLEASFVESSAGSEDPRFADLLTAIGHAATGAAKLPALPADIREGHDGTRKRQDVAPSGPDITPYLAFREAVGMLMNSFEPKGTRDASDRTLTRLANQLVGLALGALGDRGLAAFANLSEIDQAMMILSGGAARDVAAAARDRDRGNEP